jgi:DNA-directed RNA polymerase subunit K/omega
MSEVEVLQDDAAVPAEPVERPKAQPIESRFLFVDVAALRAKQLRRGAKPRLTPATEEATTATPRAVKAERMAMEEVHEGLVEWALPDFKAVFDIR